MFRKVLSRERSLGGPTPGMVRKNERFPVATFPVMCHAMHSVVESLVRHAWEQR